MRTADFQLTTAAIYRDAVYILVYMLVCRFAATIRPSQGLDYYVQCYISTSCTDTQAVQLIPRAAWYKQNICDANDDRFPEVQAPFRGNGAGPAGAWNFTPCRTAAVRAASCSCPALELGRLCFCRDAQRSGKSSRREWNFGRVHHPILVWPENTLPRYRIWKYYACRVACGITDKFTSLARMGGRSAWTWFPWHNIKGRVTYS